MFEEKCKKKGEIKNWGLAVRLFFVQGEKAA